MAKKKTSSGIFGPNPPKSSMTKDYVLEFEYMKSPFEESFWDPGEPKDSRKEQHGPTHEREPKVDRHYNKGEDYD